MKVKVLGFQKVDYVSKKTQKQVSGISLFIAREPNTNELSSVVGLITDKIWIPSKLVEVKGFIPQPDDSIELIYEFDGRSVFLTDYVKKEV